MLAIRSWRPGLASTCRAWGTRRTPRNPPIDKDGGKGPPPDPVDGSTSSGSEEGDDEEGGEEEERVSSSEGDEHSSSKKEEAKPRKHRVEELVAKTAKPWLN